MVQTLFYYCRGNKTRNLALLEQFVNEAKDADLSEGDNPYGELVGRAALIISDLYSIVPQSAADIFANQIIGLIETRPLERVVARKETAAIEDLARIALQLLFVSAALVIEPAAMPYEADEITEILKTDSKIELDPLLLAATFGKQIITGEAGRSILLRLLPMETDMATTELFRWEDAFLNAIGIHLAWSLFASATDRDRGYILQHYTYRGIVCGVPVRSWLAAAYNVKTSQISSTQFVQALLSSIELVPLNAGLIETKKLSDITHEFISVAVRETIPTLAQEKYLTTWYDSSPEGQIFRGWLRDTLTIVYKLQTNTINKD